MRTVTWKLNNAHISGVIILDTEVIFVNVTQRSLKQSYCCYRSRENIYFALKWEFCLISCFSPLPILAEFRNCLIDIYVYIRMSRFIVRFLLLLLLGYLDFKILSILKLIWKYCHRFQKEICCLLSWPSSISWELGLKNIFQYAYKFFETKRYNYQVLCGLVVRALASDADEKY